MTADRELRYRYPSVLTIAGSDSGGGAGIQADLKSFAALGCYGTSAITAVTVQNTLGVQGIHSIPSEIVAAQIRAVMDDIKPAAVKVGMVHTPELANIINETLKNYTGVPVIFDPVMVSTSGHKLILDETIAALKAGLIVSADLLTPNLDEAALLSGIPISSFAEMLEAAELLVGMGCKAVLLKGGHLTGPVIQDVYVTSKGIRSVFEAPYIETRNTHGTGCTLSAAIAAQLALGDSMIPAIEKAKNYLSLALEQGKDVHTGEGSGPLNHFFEPKRQAKLVIDRA